ncbi:MAG: PA domain-containing protein [Xanthomonadaceae bacterium]|nr:PA domain-containing protein [Xanthomonadaceae bacterium]
MKTKHLLTGAVLAALFGASATVSAADIQLINLDVGTGLGLDDPSARRAVGGNPGRTLGEQRRIAYQFAADLWGAVLQSNVPVKVTATFQPLACTPTTGTLGSAGANQIFILSGGGLPDTLFHVALAEAILGFEINGAAPEIVTRFNGDIGVNPNCLTGQDWYYGLDGNTPAGSINFLNVVMHEIGHGLGFSGFANVTTGALLAGFPDIYNLNAFNNTLDAVIGDTTLTNGQRAAAFRDDGNTVWIGPSVNQVAANFLDNQVALQVTAPAGIAGGKTVQLASFGPLANAGNMIGDVVAADDGVDTQGCNPLINGTDVAGNIALVDRGTCAFTIKVANAQAAGAVGVIIANNVSAGLPGMGGADPTISIPSVGVSQADGAAMRSNLPGVTVNGVSPDASLLAGADADGRVKLYAPVAVAPGSTFSHFDVTATPNALMEPFITGTLNAQLDIDMTPFQLQDIGWTLTAGPARFRGCRIGIEAVDDTGIIVGAHAVAQMELCFDTNSSITAAKSCVIRKANELRSAGLINLSQAGTMMRCGTR